MTAESSSSAHPRRLFEAQCSCWTAGLAGERCHLVYVTTPLIHYDDAQQQSPPVKQWHHAAPSPPHRHLEQGSHFSAEEKHVPLTRVLHSSGGAGERSSLWCNSSRSVSWAGYAPCLPASLRLVRAYRNRVSRVGKNSKLE